MALTCVFGGTRLVAPDGDPPSRNCAGDKTGRVGYATLNPTSGPRFYAQRVRPEPESPPGRPRRAFELHAIAFRVADIERLPVALRAEARPQITQFDAVRVEVGS